MPLEPLDAPASARPRALLAEAETRRRLLAVVRRRVPAQDVDDVVQQVLCDALASGGMPRDPDGLARWLVGVARHKTADLYRERARSGEAEGADVEAIAAPAPPLEARAVMHAMTAAVSREPRGAQTLEWVVREAQGERLDEMAREANLAPAAVRQRVSRLRRLLRKRWLRELLLLAAAVAAVVCVRPSILEHGAAPIVAEPTSAEDAIVAALQGTWRVEAVQSADPRAESLMSVRFDGQKLRAATPYGAASGTVRVEPLGNGRFSLLVDTGRGAPLRVRGSFDGPDRVRLESDDPAWRGAAVLARP
jgi:DNA-directed RNA polymerase specialized sigma24 family protein